MHTTAMRFGERRRDAVPHGMGLREAVQHDERRPAAGRAREDAAGLRVDPVRARNRERDRRSSGPPVSRTPGRQDIRFGEIVACEREAVMP